MSLRRKDNYQRYIYFFHTSKEEMDKTLCNKEEGIKEEIFEDSHSAHSKNCKMEFFDQSFKIFSIIIWRRACGGAKNMS